MANHVNPHHQPNGMEPHKEAYEGFLMGSIALSIFCGYIIVGLVAARFMDNWNVFTAFAGMILGLLAVLVDVRANGSWFLSGGLLVLFGAFVAINV